MSLSRRYLAALVAALGLAAPMLTQAADSYPNKLIKLVVAWPAGGDTDALARLYAEQLSKRLGQNVVVENRAGAAGSIGTNQVARAAPDGYTLLFTPNTHPIVPHVLPTGVPYHAVDDFTPIINTGTSPFAIAASNESGITSIKQFVDQVKAGKNISYGTPGAGTPMHVVGEMLLHAAGIQSTAAHYRGNAPLTTDVLGGHIPIAVVTPGVIFQHLEANKLKALAVTSSERTPVLPGVPTLQELGYDITLNAWWGVFAPKGTPAGIVNKLNAALNEGLKDPKVLKQMEDMGVIPAGGSAERMAELNASDFKLYQQSVKQFGISVQ
ncbi:MAG: tripartite tricarboxylate transporter substrate binding protein [Pigmentiphaga sp.]|uniref:Bug family tripartite tricarboxylate transporter substrate binding protein n=1 Tax=Pigmentiphaga sp. TaxID=1977564 RepID=UPI0029B5C044|nr:tripartite tricarboxylate transporter substrate binding protein [Pigmentiphaga sp.]MDX3905114.1 tripartite tricarboxylate transporter substrate binding protein [Pigmentiphaga sp.]